METTETSTADERMLASIRSNQSIVMTPQVFESIYLSPQNAVKGDLRSTFANPTPLALVGFLICLTPLSCDLMGWRGAQSNGAAGTATYFFFGGLLMLIGSILEFILGNTFPFVVFGSFGAFWLSFGGTLQPSFNAAGFYSNGNTVQGLSSPAFLNSFGFIVLFTGLLCLIYAVAALRTNIIFVLIFILMVICLGLLTASFWYQADGNLNYSARLTVIAGAFAFVTSILGWYIFTVQILAAVDFPYALPVGDLSTIVKAGGDKTKSIANRVEGKGET